MRRLAFTFSLSPFSRSLGFQRHALISQERITSIVLWSAHPPNLNQYELKEFIIVRGSPKKITIWIQEYSWDYFVYKIHLEGL